jgi:DNA-binding transcriptional LysR family regulator
VKTDALAISLAWYPRFDADPAHRWLRSIVREACAAERKKAAENTPELPGAAIG